jgi:predicted nuclease with RNAse H fold
MLTVGVDLAAEPKGTAVAEVEWRAGRAVARTVTSPADDAVILDALGRADKAGLDCPLGWPEDFIRFITAHQAGAVPLPPGGTPTGSDWRRPLRLRLTDRVVAEETGVTPLSVSADRIGSVAMRCAVLLAELSRRGQPVDRAGTGQVAEVYPAASLKVWGLLPKGGYKNPREPHKLAELIDELSAQAPYLQIEAVAAQCRVHHDAADAVIAALAARAAHLGLTLGPRNPAEAAAARTEGWVAIPRGGTKLSDLPG